MKLLFTTLSLLASTTLFSQWISTSLEFTSPGTSYTKFQLAEHTWSGSHAILFNAYKQTSVSGGLGTTGNTKYANDFGLYGGGAGAIMFYGNGGSMDFLISPGSTGANTDIDWGLPKMKIMRNGNVGIGTDSPTTKFHIEGTTSTYSRIANSSGDTRLTFGAVNGRNIIYSENYSGGPQMLKLQVSNENDFVVNASGNVGIGTASPDVKLTVSRDESGVISRFKSMANGGISGLRLEGRSNDGSDVRYMDIAYDPETYSYGFGAGSYSSVLPISNGLDKSDIVVNGQGYVGIGTANPDEQLTVDGTIHTEEVRVDLSVPGPDYVFEEDYDLRSLEETEAYIKANKHLPEVPSAKEMEDNGVQLGEMNMLLLKKVEELTLYILEQEKRIKQLENAQK